MIRSRFQEPPAETQQRVQGRRPNLFWEIVTALGLFMVRRYEQNAMDLVKIEAVSYYVKSLGKARKAVIGYIAFSCLMLLLVSGFVLFHVALLFLLPWTMGTKAALLLILGGIYFLVALGIILFATSQRTWMKYSKAKEMVDHVTRCGRR